MTATTADGFAAAVASRLGRPLGNREAFAVAVSGGPDSLALLLLAHAAFGGRVRVLTVDHGLRATAAAEAARVARYAAELGVSHATLAWRGPKPAASRQAAARAARYGLMQGWCAAARIAWLATGHHADDQTETLLLRLARGAGTGGLSGIRARRDLGDGVAVVRPLLGSTKAELAAVVAAAGWSAVDDPANCDPAFDRTRARALLAATPWLAPGRLAASAAHLADAEAALAWTADRAWASRALCDGDVVTVDAAGLPHELARRLLVRALAALAPAPTAFVSAAVVPAATPRGDAVERVLVRLAAGRTATLGGVAVRPVDRHGVVHWQLRPAARRA